MAELTIEEASVGDAPALLRLHRAVIAEQQWFISEPDEVRLSIDAKIRDPVDPSRAECGLSGRPPCVRARRIPDASPGPSPQDEARQST